MRGGAQVGARMAKLELRKKVAVENEDYDTAKTIKAEIDKLRSAIAYGAPPPPEAPTGTCAPHTCTTNG